MDRLPELRRLSAAVLKAVAAEGGGTADGGGGGTAEGGGGTTEGGGDAGVDPDPARIKPQFALLKGEARAAYKACTKYKVRRHDSR